MTTTPDKLSLDLQTARDAVNEQFEQVLSQITATTAARQSAILAVHNSTRLNMRTDYLAGRADEGTYRASLQLIEDMWADRRHELISQCADQLGELARWYHAAQEAITEAAAAASGTVPHPGLPAL